MLSTFLKRKGGLFKKAHELSVLCSVDVAVIIFGHNKKLYEYSSGDINETIGRFQYVRVLGSPQQNSLGLTLRSMAEHTNTKDLPILTEAWMTTMTMTWVVHLSKTRYRESIAFQPIYKIRRAIFERQPLHPHLSQTGSHTIRDRVLHRRR